MNDWKHYQEEAARYFRSLGLDASTDVTVKGVRTSHDIDVYVRSHYVGFEIIWIIECKHWKTPVSKLHVLALREIVADIGADRGILLAEAGFQRGAVEAANLTNVQITSLAVMRNIASESINAMRLHELFDRTEMCKTHYWAISKEERIEYGLRHDVGDFGYSGNSIITLCADLLARALRGQYPFQIDTLEAVVQFGRREKYFESPTEVIALVDRLITDLENKLSNYESLI